MKAACPGKIPTWPSQAGATTLDASPRNTSSSGETNRTARVDAMIRYDERFRILDGYAIRPDFYLPELDVYIEYWGMNTNDYKIGMLKKQELYKQQGKKLISLYPKDKPRIAEILNKKLERLK